MHRSLPMMKTNYYVRISTKSTIKINRVQNNSLKYEKKEEIFHPIPIYRSIIFFPEKRPLARPTNGNDQNILFVGVFLPFFLDLLKFHILLQPIFDSCFTKNTIILIFMILKIDLIREWKDREKLNIWINSIFANFFYQTEAYYDVTHLFVCMQSDLHWLDLLPLVLLEKKP